MTVPTFISSTYTTSYPSASNGDLVIGWGRSTQSTPTPSALDVDFTVVQNAYWNNEGIWVGQRIHDGTESASYADAYGFIVFRNASLVENSSAERGEASSAFDLLAPRLCCARDSIFCFLQETRLANAQDDLPGAYTALFSTPASPHFVGGYMTTVTRGVEVGGEEYGSTSSADYAGVGFEVVHSGGPPDTTSTKTLTALATGESYPSTSLAVGDWVCYWQRAGQSTVIDSDVLDDFAHYNSGRIENAAGVWVGWRQHDGTEQDVYKRNVAGDRPFTTSGFISFGTAGLLPPGNARAQENATVFDTPGVFVDADAFHAIVTMYESGSYDPATEWVQGSTSWTVVYNRQQGDAEAWGTTYRSSLAYRQNDGISGYWGGEPYGSSGGSDFGSVAMVFGSSPMWWVDKGAPGGATWYLGT